MNRFLKGAMILTIAGLIVKVIGALSKVVIARILGGEGIGLYQMAYPIYQIIVSIAASGVPVAISIMIADKLANKDMRGASRIFKVSFGALFVAGLVFSLLLYSTAQSMVDSGMVADPRALLAIQALAPGLFIVTMLACFRGYFQGFQYMVPTGVSQIFEQTFRVTTMVVLAYWLIDRGLDWAAAGATFATVPGVLASFLVLLVFYARQARVRQDLLAEQNQHAVVDSVGSILKRLVLLAVPVSIANIVLPLVTAIDLYIVPQRLMDMGYFMKEATTQYGYLAGMATSLIGLPIILTASLASSLVPAISEAFSLKQTHEVRGRAVTAMKVANLFTIPACVGLSVLATPVSQLLYATPHAGPVIAVMSLTIIFIGLQQITAAVLQGLGRTIIPMMTIALGLVVKVLLDEFLTPIPWLGINGAAWATNMTFALAAVLNLWFVGRQVGSVLDGKVFLKTLVSAMAMGGASLVVYQFLATLIGNNLAVAVTIVVAVVVYILTLWLTKAVVYKDLYNFPVIGKKLRARHK
ncbi:MAG: polysaccharide biosynthesis protein [Veillonella sp.]|nr:polysaccharide biosynthesis protein [Veillonella sp.]MCF0156426.1 polysaccharide biosynthesis protein [Veillonella sp.]